MSVGQVFLAAFFWLLFLAAFFGCFWYGLLVISTSNASNDGYS